MKKTLLIFVASIALAFPSFTQQLKSFTSDSAIYVQEVDKFTDNYISAAEELILEDYLNYWNSQDCSASDREEIARFSNLLLKKNGRPSPHFIAYFEALVLISSGNFDKLNVTEWKQSLLFFLENKTTSLKVIDQYLDLTLNLFKSNILYNSSATVWRVPQANFTFEFNGGIPSVSFKNVDLICYSKRDSIIISNTSGSLNPEDLSWSGSKGLISWERAGYDLDEVYAELSKYTILLQKTEYKADSVLFHYKKYFDSPLEGRIEEKVMLINKAENALYPKFYSYQNKYILPGLFTGIDFVGGLSMQGAKLTGMGNEHEPATLDIYEEDTLRMKLKTNQVLISENGMRSVSVSMSMYLDTDSIYHPDLQFDFLETMDELRFTKSKSYTSEGPYKNSYHKIDMNFEEWLWRRKSGEILFKPITGAAIGQATFESNSFFNYEFFEKLQGMDNIHPLVALWQYGRSVGLKRFPVSNYAQYLGIDEYQVRQQLMKLSRLGFIFFDDLADLVTLNEKLNYFLEASIGKIDYDVIYFTSQTNAPLENAKLTLKNKDLLINGIQRIFLSDSQNVVLLPDKNQIIMKRNRNFQFDGSIRAGLFTYFGNNFFFEYDGFKLNLQNIDSLNLQVKTTETDNYGQSIIKGISNMIENVTGELLIDNPGNKSGLVDHPEYPIFSSREDAFVFFDEPEIQKGVYGRKDIYFVVYPFTIDSLDNFSKEGMLLAGKFESGGILPPLEQTLSLRDDYSLGFYYKTPSAGIPMYNGKANFYNDVEFSGRGLHGYGQLDYITSTTYSDDFLFHPDSVMAVSRDFLIRKQIASTEYPKVNSSNNRITWYTKKDQFYAYKKDKDFTMFSDTVRLSGDLLLEPSGLSGNGRMNLVEATIGSNLFNYKSERILSDSADFRLVSPGLEIPSMNTDNINLNIDFVARKGNILSNDDFTLVEFQENRYISKLDFFNWDMMKKEIELGLSKKISSVVHEDSLSGARYISVVPSQDSLSFVSAKTIFDYRNLLLNAQEVPYIQVADARIFPQNGKLTVEKNAKIRRLTKAEILADFTHRYYNIYNSNVEIAARKDYSASGDYDYIDENKKPWTVHFTEIKVDTSVQTIGKATLSVIDAFMLSPYFEYQGEVRLAARRPDLTFDGATRLVHQCRPGRSWLKFEAEINPDSVLIPVPVEPIDINLKKIYAGTMITRDSTHIYSTFLSGRKDYFDSYLTKADGMLRYDKYKRHFEIGGMSKLSDKSLPGNYLRMDTDSCYVFGEGQIDYTMDYGQVKISSTGNASHNIERNSYESNVLMGVDFFFSPEALAILGKEMDSLTNLKAFDLTSTFYKQALRDFIGLQNAEIMETELGLYGNYKIVPESFKKNLIFSNVKLKWNQSTRSFRYHGPVGVIRVGDKAVNKEVEAYIELSNRGSGDLLDIYLVLDPNTYYYFGYNPGSMQVTSSNKNFNSIVLGLKDTDRRVKAKSGQTGYIYALAPDRRIELFLRRYQEAENALNEESEGGSLNNELPVQ